MTSSSRSSRSATGQPGRAGTSTRSTPSSGVAAAAERGRVCLCRNGGALPCPLSLKQHPGLPLGVTKLTRTVSPHRIFSHPNVLPVLGACQSPPAPHPIIITHWMPYGSLYNVLHEGTSESGHWLGWGLLTAQQGVGGSRGPKVTDRLCETVGHSALGRSHNRNNSQVATEPCLMEAEDQPGQNMPCSLPQIKIAHPGTT